MQIKTYDNFKHACTRAKDEHFDSPLATMWKKKSLEYIKQNYSESDYQSCHSKLYPVSYVIRTNIQLQKKYLETINWIEKYVEELYMDEGNIESIKSNQQPNENISLQYTYHEEILKHAEKLIKIKNYNESIKECCIAFE